MHSLLSTLLSQRTAHLHSNDWLFSVQIDDMLTKILLIHPDCGNLLCRNFDSVYPCHGVVVPIHVLQCEPFLFLVYLKKKRKLKNFKEK